MAQHGRSGPNRVPSGNRAGGARGAGAKKSAARGRTARTTNPDATGPRPTEGKVLQERLTESNRPITAGGGKKRGDRRDMHPDPGMRGQGPNRGLRNDRNPQSVAGRQRNRVPNEGG